MLKILVIDHNAVWKTYRKRYAELAKYNDIDLTVIAPKYLDMQFCREHLQPQDTGEKYKFFVVAPYGKFKSHRGFLNPFQIVKNMKSIKPDIIYIDAEPESWYAREIIFLKKIYSPNSKIILSTWMNINLYKNGFPYFCKNIYKSNYEYSLKNADGIFCYTSESEKMLRDNGYKGKIEKINWGIDTNKFKKLDVKDLKRQLNLKKFVIGYCGRFVEEKGIISLVDAVSKIKADVSLLLIGSGELKNAIIDIADNKIDLKIIDNIDNLLMPNYFNCMDVLVLPSLTTKYWKEQFGRVLIEAMACEVPVIGSSSGEIPYVIGDAGLVFKENDREDLFNKIMIMINDVNLHEKLSVKSRQRVESIYSWPNIAKGMYSFFKS